MKNVGGIDIQNLIGIISTSSPYLSINNGNAYFGNVQIDSLIKNAIAFRIQAASNTPQGTCANLDLTLSENSGAIDRIRIKLIIGKRDYLVWDPDRNNSSGPVIHSILRSLGYNGDYVNARFYSFEYLKNYKSLFICTGVAYNNFVLFRDCYEVKDIVGFINHGGNVYLEGGECWYFDPLVMHGFDFNQYFGVRPISDGYTNLGPVEGVDYKFTQGMEFGYNGENFYLDVIDSTGTGFRIFHDRDDDYFCGIANSVNNYKTVGLSFELAGLVDNGLSTKAILLDSIMHFFDIEPVGIEDLKKMHSSVNHHQILSVYPIPFTNFCVIEYQPVTLHHRFLLSKMCYSQSAIPLRIYDVSGRLIKSFHPELHHQYHSSKLIWYGDDDKGKEMPAGIYFVILGDGEFSIKTKVVKLNH
ncbi:MAG: T9SS type A sorting domain-containing protein [candidate division WOR-3 bacterium]|nr:T9SS type A sorting domain-containing protein [candidate division WOR-3 bacterium]